MSEQVDPFVNLFANLFARADEVTEEKRRQAEERRCAHIQRFRHGFLEAVVKAATPRVNDGRWDRDKLMTVQQYAEWLVSDEPSRAPKVSENVRHLVNSKFAWGTVLLQQRRVAYGDWGLNGLSQAWLEPAREVILSRETKPKAEVKRTSESTGDNVTSMADAMQRAREKSHKPRTS